MSEKRFHWVGNFDQVKNEDDLKLKPGQNINPPAPDGRCECCGKHISELKPFDVSGDSLVAFSTGKLLRINLRPLGYYDEEAERAWKEADHRYKVDGYDNPTNWMIDKYGKEKAILMSYANQGYYSSGESYECRDCYYLDENEYFEKYNSWRGEKIQDKPAK
jgi:hypothetical protein